MNLLTTAVQVILGEEHVVQTTPQYFTCVFLYAQILSIIIGIVFLFIAFFILRPKEKEQRRIQDQFLFYLIVGIFFISCPFLIEYFGY
ncbi:Transmembrane protein [Legionella anisa]|uniref:Uncharacterized protein n=1 Tax=Legionella anisa TaxID=28082 RepID=A0AAX0WSV0_9GAMM|nr:hypothetical protein DLD14_13015 [Legionella anisa]KTC77476.1 hypothetical protein Lani_0034 [Legionella anisa]PNL61422.1 hypothetical protein A6J39_009455 [Legionella anisa]